MDINNILDIHNILELEFDFNNKNFYFMSGCESPHDLEVLKRTGAKYLDKLRLWSLESILKDLS